MKQTFKGYAIAYVHAVYYFNCRMILFALFLVAIGNCYEFAHELKMNAENIQPLQNSGTPCNG